MREVRLGDDIDDFCVRCKRVMNHDVVSVLNGGPAKVRCRTCHSDHDYRHEQPPPPKVDARKAALFNEVLKKVDPDEGSGVDVADAEMEDSLEQRVAAGEAAESAEAADAAEAGEGAGPAKAAKKPLKGR